MACELSSTRSGEERGPGRIAETAPQEHESPAKINVNPGRNGEWGGKIAGQVRVGDSGDSTPSQWTDPTLADTIVLIQSLLGSHIWLVLTILNVVVVDSDVLVSLPAVLLVEEPQCVHHLMFHCTLLRKTTRTL